MKKTSFIAITLIFSIVLISGCVQQSSTPTCNEPYIVKGFDCCLDQNSNKICDSDEQIIEQTIEPVEYCGDGKCNFDENCSSCKEDCGECQNETDNETELIKTSVKDAVLKYVLEAEDAEYKFEERLNEEIGYDTWYYPVLPNALDTSEYIISVEIKDHHFNISSPQSLYEKFTTSPDFGTDDIILKKLGNGDILVTDKSSDGRYDFFVEFTCNRRYEIKISTWDFYGTDISQKYKDYDIDRAKIEKIADDVLGKC